MIGDTSYLTAEITLIDTATWQLVDATLAENNQTSFTASGSVNLSCLEGNVRVAFRYLGGDGGVTSTFQIDDVKITGN